VIELIDQLLANNFQPHFALDQTAGDPMSSENPTTR
jgi:hypothetical protein